MVCESDEQAAMMSPLRAGGYDHALSFIALWNGELFGWVICRRLDEETVYFSCWYVVRKFRPVRGGGVRVAAEIIRRIIRSGCRTLKLYMGPRNDSLRRFYAFYFKDAFIPGARRFEIELRAIE